MGVQVNDLLPSDNERLRTIAAQNKLVQMGNKYGEGVGDNWLQAAQLTSAKNNLPLYYITDTIDRENAGYQPMLRNPHSSATGLGQFTHATAQDLNLDPTNPIESIIGIGDYLGKLKHSTGSNDFKELTHAYVLGPSGYRQQQHGGSPAGVEQLGAVDAFLNKKGLSSNQSPNDSQAPLSQLAHTNSSRSHSMTLPGSLDSGLPGLNQTNTILAGLKEQRDNLINSSEADM